MSHNIPLIRAAAIAPILRWLHEIGRDPSHFLARAGLEWISTEDPLLPIPLRNAILLLVEVARAEGPDAPYRLARNRSAFEIGFIGAAALEGPTVRAGLRRLARCMPLHCTHELFTVDTAGSTITVRDGWTMKPGDAETLHYVQQYVAAVLDMICGVATGMPSSVAQVGLVAHPKLGVTHLRPWLGVRVCSREDRMLKILIDGDVSDKPMPAEIREQASALSGAVPGPLDQGQTLSEDVATLLSRMLPSMKPSVDAIAASAGMSSRTFRRRLSDEGQTFSNIVECTRAEIALRRLQEPAAPMMRDLALELGYASQATLTRAMRRWTGNSPREILSMAKHRSADQQVMSSR